MKISINTYGRVVTVDHRSHVVGVDLTAIFPGVAHVHYDSETGIGAIEYIPTPPHTFYGMDGIKGLSDVLKAWNDEDAAYEKAVQDQLASIDKSNAPADDKAKQVAQLQEELNPAQAEAARKKEQDQLARADQAVNIVIEDD
jgi:hypothetical protein